MTSLEASSEVAGFSYVPLFPTVASQKAFDQVNDRER